MRNIKTQTPFINGAVGYMPLCDRRGEVLAWAKVDAVELDRLATHRWSMHALGYAVRKQRRSGTQQTIYLGREVLRFPSSGAPRIRHLNGERLDCRRVNLRPSNAWTAQIISNSDCWALAQLAHSTRRTDAA